MSNATEASIYEILNIEKLNKETNETEVVNIKGKTVSFKYYESLLSPNATGALIFVDTGNAIVSKTDKQERTGSIYNALPLTGQEKIKFKISSKLGTINFSSEDQYFQVNKITNLKQESQKEAVSLELISRRGLENHSKVVRKKFNGKISDSVTSILTESFGITDDKIQIDPTQNTHNFNGYDESPFSVILDLAPQSISTLGDPGYFFYETQNGMNFRSIDSLIKDGEEKVKDKTIPTYYYSAGAKSSVGNDGNDNKIISYVIAKNNDIVNALKSGVYESRAICFNPYTSEVMDVRVRLSNNVLKTTLAKDVAELEKSDNNYSRTYCHVLDVGMNSPGIDVSINNNPCTYVAKSRMRYNILTSQVLNMTIPCNPNLVAGDIIRCEFESITDSEKELGAFDQNQSGNWMILDLCHHFEPNRSYTGLRLVRDSYGIYKSEGK